MTPVNILVYNVNFIIIQKMKNITEFAIVIQNVQKEKNYCLKKKIMKNFAKKYLL